MERTRTSAKSAGAGSSHRGEQLFVNLMHAHEVLGAGVTELFRDRDLTSQQYNVLRILRGAGTGGLPTLTIRERMITRVPDITRLLDRLEKAGLVRRVRGEEDRRVVRIEITDEGLALLKEIDRPLRALHARQSSHLSDREIDTLNRLLIKLRKPHEERIQGS